MELKSKELFSKTLGEIIAIKRDCDIPDGEADGLKYAVDTMPLRVPVVGEFSAGKSTLLNQFMGKNVLSVGITPETAIAAELYYSENEYDEGVDENGNVVRLSSLDGAAEKFAYVRRHINSEALKKIEPIVLVDMPGFDSPKDEHNKAIFSYLDKGAHYIVLTPVDAGTVSSSMSKQIQNIMTFGKSCSFFLSKANLRSDEEVSQVKNELENELFAIVGEAVNVYPIRQNDISNFDQYVETHLNPDELFRNQFCEKIKDECHETKSSLNTKISALQSDEKKNARAIEELKTSIKKIEDRKARMIANAKNDTFADEAEMVAGAVGNALSSQVDSLADIAIRGGQDALEDEIHDIVQSTITSKIQNVTTSISGKFSRELTSDMRGLSEIMNSFMNTDIVQKLQNSAQNMYDVSKAGINSYIADRKDKEKSGGANVGYKVVTGILAATTTIVAPWLEVIIILLPEIFNLILGNFQKKRQREEMCSQISSQIPSVKRKVREQVSKFLKENSESMILNISQSFDEQLNQKKEEIEAAKREMEQGSDIPAQIEKYRMYIGKVDGLLEAII